MAKKFATSLKLPYKGAIANYPVQYCGGAKALPFYFPWRQYGTYLGADRKNAINPGVQFSSSNPPTQVLSTVQGVFIDNTDCASPVYLQCEDTGHMVACADNATAYFPLMTSGTNFTLYIETVDGPFQRDQQTNVFLLDKAVPPFLQGQASNRFISLAQISGQENFTTPVLSDQLVSDVFTISFPDSTGGTRSTSIIPAVVQTALIVSQISLDLVDDISSNVLNGFTISDIYLQIGGTRIVGFGFPKSTVNGSSVRTYASQSLGAPIQNLTLRLSGTSPLLLSVTASNGSGQPQQDVKLRPTIAYARVSLPTT